MNEEPKELILEKRKIKKNLHYYITFIVEAGGGAKPRKRILTCWLIVRKKKKLRTGFVTYYKIYLHMWICCLASTPNIKYIICGYFNERTNPLLRRLHSQLDGLNCSLKVHFQIMYADIMC